MPSMHVIAVRNLARSTAWYRDVLGCEVRDLGDPGWRVYVFGDVRIMAGECPDEVPAGDTANHSYFAYVYVEDAADLHAAVAARGAEFCKSLRDEPWGMREFGVRTVDGHRMMFGQELGVAD